MSESFYGNKTQKNSLKIVVTCCKIPHEMFVIKNYNDFKDECLNIDTTLNVNVEWSSSNKDISRHHLKCTGGVNENNESAGPLNILVIKCWQRIIAVCSSSSQRIIMGRAAWQQAAVTCSAPQPMLQYAMHDSQEENGVKKPHFLQIPSEQVHYST